MKADTLVPWGILTESAGWKFLPARCRAAHFFYHSTRITTPKTLQDGVENTPQIKCPNSNPIQQRPYVSQHTNQIAPILRQLPFAPRYGGREIYGS